MGRLFMVPWLTPALAILLFAALLACLVASYWWRNRPSNAPVEAGVGIRRFLPLSILAVPALVAMGFFLLVFPVGLPESIVLRSRAALLSAQFDQTCIERAFADLTRPGAPVAGCEQTELEQDSWIVDAGPLVLRALDTFNRQNFTSAQLEEKGSAVLAALRHAVNVSLMMSPRLIETLPEKPGGSSAERRWLIQTIEVAVLEGLTLSRNVRNVVIERHLTDFDEAPADPWQALSLRLENQTKAHRPAVRIENGSRLGTHAYASISGLPWLRQRGSNVELFVMVLKGPEESDARLSFTAGGNEMRLACAGGAPAPSLSLYACADGFKSSAAGTQQLIAIRVEGELGNGPYWLKLTIDNGEPFPKEVMSSADSNRVQIATRGAIQTTLRCLLDESSTAATAFREQITTGGRQGFELASSGAHVSIETDALGLWIIPGDARPGLRDEIADAQLRPESPIANSTREGRSNFGLMLFPYVARADAGPQVAASLTEIPVSPNRQHTYDDPKQDPARNVAPPTSLWISRGDARPAAFSYARQNNIEWVDSIQAMTLSPMAWRIDVPSGRTNGRLATVWRYAIDIERQGLLLREGCKNSANPPDMSKSLLDRAISLYEPNYESSRFFPFWGAVLSAARTAASPDSELGVA